MRKNGLTWPAIILATCLVTAVAWADTPTKPWPTVKSIKADKTTAAMFERVTINVELDPAEPEGLAAIGGEVFASVKTPSGQSYSVPGFL